MKDVVSWSDIQPLVEHDIQSVGVPRGEFVVSQMTKAISNAIKFAFEQGDMPDLPTLDIGTGTGYHTMLYLALGQARVFSIDINPQALVFAKE
ncbi:MAG: class I SAM-dependent methyltransferase, partial [Bacteroidota bacterium]